MLRRPLVIVAIVAVVAALAWVLIAGVPGARGRTAAPATGAAPAAAPGAEKKITATLYFVSEDGMALVGVQREVPFGEPIAEQARSIVQAQLGAAPAPYAAAVPSGTSLRAVYVTERDCTGDAAACKRDAFVDLSADARTKHTGGSLDEIFTIYAIVNAVTVNLPAISRVQILVDGKEVDTLAGHVDLRHPLEKNLTWVKTQKDG